MLNHHIRMSLEHFSAQLVNFLYDHERKKYLTVNLELRERKKDLTVTQNLGKSIFIANLTELSKNILHTY